MAKRYGEYVFLSLIGLLTLNSLELVATEEFAACTASVSVECQLREVPNEECAREFLFYKYMDPVCEAKIAAIQAKYEADYRNCLLRKQVLELECENNKLQRELAVNQGTIKAGNSLQPYGTFCTSDTECKSGYCYPGPPTNTKSYCLHRDFNCALPNSVGVRYGYTIEIDGRKYTCAPGGRGRAGWAILE